MDLSGIFFAIYDQGISATELLDQSTTRQFTSSTSM